MQVSSEIASAYKSTSIHKDLIVKFPELGVTVPHSKIYSESMTLKESIFDQDSMEFVGCISSMFTLQIHGENTELKGKRIEVGIKAGETEEIKLFSGIVDSAVKQSNKWYKKITAYDELYTKGNTEVAGWYKSLSFPITIKAFRDSLFNYIGITQEEKELPNDGISIGKKYAPNTLKALDVIKSICQINGTFGIINREGVFEYRILSRIGMAVYPSHHLYPSDSLYPFNPDSDDASKVTEAEYFPFYKSVNWDDFVVKPVDKLTIRQSEKDSGISYGSGDNNYIIQGNMFTYGLSSSTLQTMAKNIYKNVKGFSYYPFDSDNNGLPYVECGEAIAYEMIDWVESETSEGGGLKPVYSQQSFYVLDRQLSGIQSLRDNYQATGEEYQNKFVTDLKLSIDLLKQKENETDERIEDIESRLDDLEGGITGGGGFNVESVSALPENPDENTIYLIQGIVVVE